MLPSVYIETTIPSYLTSRPSRDIIRAAHQQLTKDWWHSRRHAFRLFTSTFVLAEAGRGDPEAAQARLSCMMDIPLLPVLDEIPPMASKICASAGIPEHAKMDGAHLAIASLYSMDFFLTWNCTHLNNAQLLPIVEKTIAACGHSCPVVCTPEELMGI